MSKSESKRRQAWAYLSRVVEGPSRNLSHLLDQGRDPEEIVRGIKNQETWIGKLAQETEPRAHWDQSEQDLETIARLGGRLITPEDPEWPSVELGQAFQFAASGTSSHIRSYQSDAVAPHALWVRGGNLGAACAQSVTIVGTRAMSRYGAEVTTQLVQSLVSHQWTIISGGAIGVDTAAHTAALQSGGSTIIVAACGLDRSYPARNTALFEAVASSDNSVLVSEYPPGATPQRHRFLTRNRLVAALSRGTVVVEAAWRSGALNTLSWASGLGKVAMAVPGPVTSAGSLGCHERIASGDAQLVASADDIRMLLGSLGQVSPEKDKEVLFAATPIQSLSRNEMRVFDGLDNTPKEAKPLSMEIGLPLGLVVHLLVDLDRRGLVQRQGTAWVCSKNFAPT